MAAKAVVARPNLLSEEYVQESSDEGGRSEEDTSTGENPSKKAGKDHSANKQTPNGVGSAPKQKDTPSSESSQSSQESSSAVDEDATSNGELSNSSSGSRKRRRESEKTTNTSQSSKKRKKSKKTTPVRIAGKPFIPPPGFEVLVPDASDYTSDAAGIFVELGHKQVWHISAPASVNLSSIQELDISAALRGDPIVTQNGMRYGLQSTTSPTDNLLLPQDSNAAYRPSKTRISRGFQLKAIDQEGRNASNKSTLDDSSTPSTEERVFTAQARGLSKPPRQQPAGLKTRYVPYGVIDRDTSSKWARTFPGHEENTHSEPATTGRNQTPSKPIVAVPAATTDPRDVDAKTLTANGSVGKGPQRPADPSPTKSSVPDTPREKQKKKKKRSKLVDNAVM